jgi:hypothetical protein
MIEVDSYSSLIKYKCVSTPPKKEIASVSKNSFADL